jgi:sugar/nucleoside kinase (ribokinase family)
MAHTYDVAAMGNALLDVLAPADDAFLLRHNIAKGVMTLIDEFRALQLYEALSGTREIAGGSAANTAAGVASFGAKGLYVGKVKDDPLGPQLCRKFESDGRAVHNQYGGRRARDRLLPDRSDALTASAA